MIDFFQKIWYNRFKVERGGDFLEYGNLSMPDLPEGEVQYYCECDPRPSPATSFPAHIHDCLEVYLLIEGDVSFLVEGQLYRLKSGDAILTRPNEVHNCILNSETLHHHYCFWFRSDSEFFFGDFLHGKAGSGHLLSPTSDEQRSEILAAAKEVHRLCTSGAHAIAKYAATVRLLSLWHECLAISGSDSDLPKQLRRILDDISENLPEIHNLSYFTEKYHVNPSQLRKLFAQYLHSTPKSYLENRRLAYSRVLLRSGRNVTEACMESGFPDLSNYIRLFRTHFGITPADYQKGKSNKNQPVPNLYL